MGAYIVQADIENIFGKDNIEIWSQLDDEAGADTTRIAKAITVAEEDVENRFRFGKYGLPFAPVPEVVKDWCARLAGIWLFENRPIYKRSEEEMEGFEDVRELVDRQIEFYLNGSRVLNCGLAKDNEKGGPAVVM